MGDEVRNSGIDVIGSVPWGTHFCQFYKTKQDLIDTLVPYFKAGLEDNEFCMWVTSEPLMAADAEEAVRGAVVNFDEYLRRRQIEIIPYDEWYLLGGTFDDDRVLNGWIRKLEQALAMGRSGLRLTGNTFWLERNHWQAFTEYEAKVNNIIGKYQMLAICTYCLDKCDGTAVIDVVRNHQFALAKREGRWDIIESSIYKQAKEQIAHLASFPELNPSPVLELDTAGNVKYLNPATEALFPGLALQGCQHAFLTGWDLLLRALKEKESHTLNRDIKIGEMWYEQSYFLSPSTGDVRLYAWDITERKRAEQALRDSEEKFRTVSDFTYDWEYWRSPDNKFIFVSPSCLSLTGYDVTEFMTDPKLYLDIIHPDDRERVAEHMRDNMQYGQEVELEFRIMRRDGQERWMHHACQPVVDTDGNFLGRRGSNRDITDRKKMEEALRDTERDLSRAQAVAHTGSWRLNVQLNQLLWSDETYRIFGVSKGTSMTYEAFLSCVHPEDREYVDQKWQAALRGEPYDTEHRIVVDDGIRWVHEKAELEFDSQGLLQGGFGTVQDITERKRIENELRVKDYAVTSAVTGIAIADLDGNLTDVNLACLSMWGYDKEGEILGKHTSSFFAERSEANAVLKEILEKGVWQGEAKAIRKDGSKFDVQVSANLVTDFDGSPICRMASFVDVTERKKLDQLKDEFIGLVSHELRTPLTVISGCLSTMLTEWNRLSSGEVQQLLKDALLESESLSHLIENLLELSRAQAQQLALYPELIDVKRLVRETLSKIKRQATSHRFVTSIPDELPSINGDPLRIERILYNLLDNAAKYSPPGSQIKVSASAEPERLVIRVSDRGAGLTASEQARIFRPFQRLENSRPDQARGAGLGLMVCRRLVEAHGGEIWVESKKGRGSTFLFSLPRRKGTDADADRA